MTTPRTLAAALAVLAVPLALGATVLLHDDFSSAQHPQRQIPTNRGAWKLADGMATSAHDDELYKKNKNHGAVIWYDLAFTDGVVKFTFRPQDCETVAFTLNTPQGHGFRFIQSKTGLAVLAWESHEPGARATPLLKKDAPDRPKLRNGEWTEVEIRFAGKKCDLRIGDFRRTYENPGIAVAKSRFGVHYDRGTFSVRDVKVESL